MSETKLPLGERLRKVAADDRALAQRANEYFHRYQESAGWYNAVIKGEYQDRSDYAPTLERCALLEEAANALEGVKQSEDALRDELQSLVDDEYETPCFESDCCRDAYKDAVDDVLGDLWLVLERRNKQAKDTPSDA